MHLDASKPKVPPGLLLHRRLMEVFATSAMSAFTELGEQAKLLFLLSNVVNIKQGFLQEHTWLCSNFAKGCAPCTAKRLTRVDTDVGNRSRH